ncbi:MAG TPA: hypothetical protein VFB21_17465 [Chthonomonadaceae bacterium]|nr:hypothetical protein [Chthonomonadaceae bacterium]
MAARFASIVLLLGLLVFPLSGARADAAGDKRRVLLASVRRIAVVPPFFGTDTLARVSGSEEADKTEKASRAPEGRPAKEPDAREKRYAEQLRRLEAHVRTTLPARVAARTPFAVVPADELAKAFEALNLTPAKLFQNGGRIRSARFAAPDAQAVSKLADFLHADAVLLGTLDEPRRSNGRYYFDMLSGLSYDSAHVRGKAGYYLLLADGTEALHAFIEVLQPLSRIGNRDYILADWMDAESLVIENLMDEITRYAPEKSAKR